MEFIFQETQNVSSPYVTAPTSPSGLTPQNNIDLVLYHTTPSSPCNNNNNNSFSYDLYSSSFRTIPTSPKSNDFEFESLQVGSLSSITFEGDLLCVGKLAPLKLPPRLQTSNPMKPKVTKNRGLMISSLPASPKRKATPRRSKLDPFTLALQKVTEDRGRRRNVEERDGNHKRFRSHSPFRTNTASSIENNELKSNLISLPVDFKGSKYARYVRAQTNSSICNVVVQENASKTPMVVESKLQRIKGLLLKIATFGRQRKGKRISGFRKQSYISRLSYKLKGGSGDTGHNGKERKMVLVKYRPVLCIGYGMNSPRNSFGA